MKTRLTVLRCTAILASTIMVYGQAASVEVRGFRSCGVWVNEGKAMQRGSSEAWLVGYLSGLAAGSDKNILKGTDNPSIFLWMDQYCQNNPIKDISDGGLALYFEMKKQKGL